MDYLLEDIMKAMNVLHGAEFALTVGQMFLWIIAWYIAWQLWRLRWALLVMWGDIISLALIFYQSRHRFIGYPETPMSPIACIIEPVLIQIINIIALVLITVGAVKTVRCLQIKWKQKDANTQEGLDATTNPQRD